MNQENTYVLTHDADEQVRLERQHAMFKKFLNRDTSIVPHVVDPSSISTVLDAAAGTLVWSRDFATIPEIKPRISSPSNPVKLYACDLTAEKFPPKPIVDALGIQLFLHDVTKPFPEEMTGMFDLVNMKLLILALSKDGWLKALSNIREVLKPGGILLLNESDGHFYAKEELELGRAASPVSHSMTASWTYPMNQLFIKNAEMHQHLTDLSKSLPEMVRSTGLTISSQFSVFLPMGALCLTELGPFGQSVASEAEFTRETFVFMVNTMTGLGFRYAYLKDENGDGVVTEEGRKMVADTLVRTFDAEGGVFFSCTDIVARKV